ncbi:N-acetyltransferase family protein [Aestuariibius insulae]|uniref:GNAT family N-acetyltransferase n=1 Tax=Aestuariibius insulae TaxID=2058287 RepID=UPI00345ED6A5
MTFEIRALGPDDLAEWRSIRLEALKTVPEAFLTTYDEERALTDEAVAKRLKRGTIRAIFSDNALAGVLAFVPMTAAACRHRAEIFAVYTRPSYRKTGATSALFDAVLAEARERGFRQLELSVAADNLRAIRFYERYGFKWQGRIPRAVRLGDRWQDDHFYVLSLTQDAS